MTVAGLAHAGHASVAFTGKILQRLANARQSKGGWAVIDRQTLETLLSRRFPGSTRNQIAAAANAIMGLEHEWKATVAGGDVDALAPVAGDDAEFRLLRPGG